MRAGRLIAAYAGTMAVLVAAYLALPGAAAFVIAFVGAASAAAILMGVRLYRPIRTLPWRMLAAALALNASARVVYDLLPGAPGTLKPGIWLVWLIHLVMAVLLLLGLLGLTQRRARDRATVIDVAIIVLGGGLVLGVLVAVPYASTPGIGTLWASVRVAYVARDVVLLAVAAYLALAIRRSTSALLIQAGLAALVGYDVIFRLGRAQGEWLSGTPLDVLWFLSFAAIGAATLVPPIAGAVEISADPAAKDIPANPRARLGLVTAVALTPSVLLLVDLFQPPRWYQGLLVLTSAAVLVLAFARTVDMAERFRDQARGEQVVRETAVELADANEAADVGRTLSRAVGLALGTTSDYAIALSTGPSSQQPNEDQPMMPAQICATADLSPPLAAELGGRGTSLALPLTATRTGGPVGEYAEMTREPSLLYVRADQRTLERLHGRLSALATQAGLALQRIGLRHEQLRLSRESYFRALVQKSTDVIIVIDDENRIMSATPSAAALVGRRSLIGRSALGLIAPDDRRLVERLLAVERGATESPTDAEPPEHRDSTVRLSTGPPTMVELACRDLGADPSIGGLVLTLRDVTQQRRLENELADRAFHDPLTGLWNQQPFTERVDQVMNDQHDPTAFVGALYIDLDDMKLLNDNRGHEAGDAILIATGERLSAFVASQHEPSDAAARLGGDEFAVLLAGTTERELARAATHLTHALAEPVPIGDEEVACAASIGLANSRDADTARDLLRDAGLARYSAKETGKRQWRRYEPWMHTTLMARMQLQASLEDAVSNDEFLLEYQPIVGLADGATVGFEALLRWEHPTRGRLSPDEFIDVAEKSGHIAPISEWVVATALKAASRWPRDGASMEPYVAVNVSAPQFSDRRFVDTVLRLLAATRLPARAVLVEITESLLLHEDDHIWRDLQRLRGAGIRIAIDDFGTGHSALSYLRRVPLDVVKLDRSFLRSINESAQQRELVRGIVGLARTLDLRVVAEGIETHTEWMAAREVGCDDGQGYFFSRPLPEAAANRWWRDNLRLNLRTTDTAPVSTE